MTQTGQLPFDNRALHQRRPQRHPPGIVRGIGHRRATRWLTHIGTIGVLMPVVLAAELLTGCDSGTAASYHGAQPGGFRVSQVALQPAFMKVRPQQPHSNGTANSHGGSTGTIEAYMELKDQFGDSMKGLGDCRFELFRYQPAMHDPRGPRFETDGVQAFDFSTAQKSQPYWNSTTRSYRIPLDCPPGISSGDRVVVQVTFILAEDYRLQDMATIQASQ